MVYVLDAESDKAKEYLEKSLRLFEELGDRFWTAIPLNYLGEHFHYRGDATTAINAFGGGGRFANTEESRTIALKARFRY